MRYAHTNIVARDWRALAQFYVGVFGCRIQPPERHQGGEWLSRGTGVPNARLEGVHLLLPGHGERGPTLEIYSYGETVEREQGLPNHRGLGHLAFEVDDVAVVLERLRQHGGSALGEVTRREVEAGTITFVYARDPEGNIIELQSWA
jgi:catechol 2,3-dioxygenase-like lactoylglutathione lyase family enzyme